MPKLSRSIEELEGVTWGDAPFFSSNLVKRCHALRRKSVNELTPEEIGVAIRQKIGLFHVLGIAVEMVRNDPLIEGAFYPGDILSSLINLPSAEWRGHPNLKAEFDTLHQQALAKIACQENDDWEFLGSILKAQP